MTSSVTVKEIMQSEVITLEPEMSLARAWQLFTEHGISGAPVVREGHGVVGVLSQTDLVREAYSDDLQHLPRNTFYVGVPYWGTEAGDSWVATLADITVEEAMNPYVLSVSPDDDLPTLAATMRSNGVHRVIVAKDQALLGIVTAMDLLRMFESH